MSLPQKNQNISKQNKHNLVIAVLVGQVGILTLVIILAAVFGGMALDARFGTKPWFTIGLLVASIPVSLILMIFVARKTVKNLKNTDTGETHEEDAIEKDS